MEIPPQMTNGANIPVKSARATGALSAEMIDRKAGPENMDPAERCEAALERLSAALEKLEAATERRVRAEALRANLEEELAVIQDDRSRLAVELDGALARSISLETTSQEVARRLNGAGEAVKAVLSALEAEH